MQRLRNCALVFVVVVAGLASGCIASHKYVKKEVKTSADALNAEIDKTNGQVKETQDSVTQVNTRVAGVDQRVTTVDQRVTGVSGKVDEVDSRTTQNAKNVDNLKGEVGNVNSKTDANSKDLNTLDEKFQKRNNYAVESTTTILFAFDSSKLNKDSFSQLDEIAAKVMANPDAILVMEGHTDNIGDQNYNITLGERRVESVKRYLAVEKGVPIYKIENISFGAAKPIAPNDSKQSREQNRAVTLNVLTPAMGSSNATAQVR